MRLASSATAKLRWIYNRTPLLIFFLWIPEGGGGGRKDVLVYHQARTPCRAGSIGVVGAAMAAPLFGQINNSKSKIVGRTAERTYNYSFVVVARPYPILAPPMAL